MFNNLWYSRQWYEHLHTSDVIVINYTFTIRLPALAKRHAATAIYYFAIERRRAAGMFSLPAANDDRSRLLSSSNDLTRVDSYFFPSLTM